MRSSNSLSAGSASNSVASSQHEEAKHAAANDDLSIGSDRAAAAALITIHGASGNSGAGSPAAAAAWVDKVSKLEENVKNNLIRAGVWGGEVWSHLQAVCQAADFFARCPPRNWTEATRRRSIACAAFERFRASITAGIEAKHAARAEDAERWGRDILARLQAKGVEVDVANAVVETGSIEPLQQEVQKLAPEHTKREQEKKDAETRLRWCHGMPPSVSDEVASATQAEAQALQARVQELEDELQRVAHLQAIIAQEGEAVADLQTKRAWAVAPPKADFELRIVDRWVRFLHSN
jgi:hypothetical protein